MSTTGNEGLSVVFETLRQSLDGTDSLFEFSKQ